MLFFLLKKASFPLWEQFLPSGSFVGQGEELRTLTWVWGKVVTKGLDLDVNGCS
jgi:hypothetical protein